jgi:hypothetical protein
LVQTEAFEGTRRFTSRKESIFVRRDREIRDMLIAKRLGRLGSKMPCLVSNAGIWKCSRLEDFRQLGEPSGMPREDLRAWQKVRGIFLVLLGANPAIPSIGQANQEVVCNSSRVIVRKTLLLLAWPLGKSWGWDNSVHGRLRAQC